MAFSGFRDASSGFIAALRKRPRLRRRRARKAAATPAAANTSTGNAATTTIASLAPLVGIISEYLDEQDINHVKNAWRLADEAHLGQFRATGEPYITHP